MDGRQALRARMARSARSFREQCRSEETPEGSAGVVCESLAFLVTFWGVCQKVTRRKGKRGQNCH